MGLQADCRYAATIGFFDGVHRGHRFLIDQLKAEAQSHGLGTMVITFGQHPRQIISPGWHPRLLTTPQEKKLLLQGTGIDRLVVLSFDKALSQLPARLFMQQVLRDKLGVGLLLTGYDNHFGHREPGTAAEGFADYVNYGRELGIEVVGAAPLSQDGLCPSSSVVRRLLAEGDVETAAKCLGRPYSLSGRVVHGHQVGRQIGFPTANIQSDHPDKLVPREGVYAVRVALQGVAGPWLPGMMNIGHRPTFNGHHTTLEAHLFDFHDSLYDQSVSVAFVARLRSEQSFGSADELVSQMQQDALVARCILSSTPQTSEK
jgi:riboflavin kinase/FMN adenylyltransferase